MAGDKTEFVSNCINNGNVSGANAGGFMGQTTYYWDSGAVMLNCLNTGNVTGNSYLGGFVGLEYSRGTLVVANCVNAGSIQEIENAKGFIGGYDGDYHLIMGETNCYSVSLPNTPADACTLEQLNTKSFYVDTLGWSEDVWDFSNIDVQNGKYPTLKITNKT